jgi:hypothetical protein
MAEMTALVVAVYRGYTTSLASGFEDKSPAITSRFELFYDETVPEIAVSFSRCEILNQTLTALPGTYMFDQLYKGVMSPGVRCW